MDGTSKWETAGTILWQEQEGRRVSRNSGPLLSLHSGGCVHRNAWNEQVGNPWYCPPDLPGAGRAARFSQLWTTAELTWRLCFNIFLEKSRFWRCILVGSEGRWWRFDRVFHRRKSGTHDNQRSKNIIRMKKTICRCLTCMGKPLKLSEFKYFGDLTAPNWD